MADPNTPTPAPALDFDVMGAMKAGYSEKEIASYLGSQTGFDVEGARKVGYTDNEIVRHLMPAPAFTPKAAEPAPEPVSGTLKGMAKAAGQTVAEIPGNLVKGFGAQVAATGTGLAALDRMDSDAGRQRIALMDKIDRGETVKPIKAEGLAAPSDPQFEFAMKYMAADEKARADLRQKAINDIAERQIEPGAAPRIAQSAKKVGGEIFGAGQRMDAAVKAAIPLTPEEEERPSVQFTKALTGLAGYVGAGAVGGLAGVIGYAGTEAMGQTYEEAKAKGASDEEAASAGVINGLVQGGLMVVPVSQAMRVMEKLPGALKGKFVAALVESAKSGATLTAFSQLSQLADNVVAKSTYDPDRPVTQGLGEHLGPTFAAGAVLPGLGVAAGRVANRFRPKPEDAAKRVMDAGTVDEAIDAARTVIEAPPVDVDAIAAQAQEYGGTAEQQQAKLLQLFGGLNRGEVIQAEDGGYHYRLGDGDKGPTHPLKVWDEKAPGAEGAEPTIAPALAAAQREHYRQLGIDVVYFEDAPGIPFDGAVSPTNPNTIFLSNHPERNAAQVAAHEVTHVLESTILPDGTNLGDVLHSQITEGLTNEGLRHAYETFGKTAPERAAFPAGPEGDSAHADAVVSHLVRELGADIGGEAPRFQTFIPKVIEAVQARYGLDAAKDVLRKLIDGIQNAMRTLRTFFARPEEHAEYGQPETVSQNWVTNLGEVHDTLAKMYAERYGSQAEKETSALVTMRNKAERDRYLRGEEQPPAAPEGFFDHGDRGAPIDPNDLIKNAASGTFNQDGNRVAPINSSAPEAPASITPDAQQPAVAEVHQRIVTLRRWLGELEAQRREEAPSSPQATLLKQTEDAILRKVNGVEERLTGAQAERLAKVRADLDALVNPTGDSPDMARVRQALLAEQQRLADAAAVGSPAAPAGGRSSIRPRAARQEAERIRTVMPEAEAPKVEDRPVEQPAPVEAAPEAAPAPVLEAKSAPVIEAPAPAEQAAPTAAAPTAPRPERAAARVAAPSELESLDPATLKIDAKRFQFKSGGDQAGVTERLQGVQHWDPRLAGTILVWRDGAGQDWVADGHQRVGLASRLSQTQPGIKVNAFVLNSRDSITAADARAIAAAKNIAEGTGTAIDAAKVFRDAVAKGIALPELPPRSALVRDGKELAKLSPEAFGIVVNEVIPANQGAIVGRLVENGHDQVEAMRLLAEAKPENVRQAEMIIRDMLSTGTERGTKEGGLFGPEAFASSVVLERAKVLDEAERQIARDRTVFRALVAEAERIQSHGENRLDVKANEARLSTDERASQFLTQLATRKGPVSDALTDVARQFKDGKLSRAAAAREFTGTVRRAVEAGLDTGPDAGRPVAGAERTVEPEAAQSPKGDAPLFSPKPRRTDTEPPGPVLIDTRAATSEELAARQRAVEKEEAEMRMRGRKASGKPQQSADDLALFGGERQKTLFSPKKDEPFYSALTRGVEGLRMEKATPGQWEATIRNMPGVKVEERAWVGVDDWLRQQTRSVTKADVLDYLREHEVRIEEIEKRHEKPTAVQRNEIADRIYKTDYFQLASEQKRVVDDALEAQASGGATKFGTYVMPGGENYREMLLTLPPKPSAFDPAKVEIKRNLRSVTQGDTAIWYDGKKLIQYSDDPQLQPGGGYKQRPDEYWMETARKLYEQGDARNSVEAQGADFRGGHWDEANVLAHVRFDDRTGPNGEKILHIAEVQSDWHQKGRRQGYRDEAAHKAFDDYSRELGAKYDLNPLQNLAMYGRLKNMEPGEIARYEELQSAAFKGSGGKQVPDAPFKTSWPELALKRMLRYAAENGYDRVSWDTGDTNAARFDLSRHIEDLTLHGQNDNMRLSTTDKNGRKVMDMQHVTAETLPDLIGKEATEKLLSQPEPDPKNPYATRNLFGADLKVGGEGMRAFYDKQLPIIASKIGKKFGAKVEDTRVPTDDKAGEVVREDGRWFVLDAGSQLEGRSFNTEAEARAALSEGAVAHSIAITPAMREGVMQGQPLFSPKLTGESRERAYTPEQIEANKAFATDKTVMEKIRGKMENLPENAVIQTLDRFYGIKGDDPLGYMGLRLSNNAAGATEAFMTASTLRFDGRTYNWKERTGGVESLVRGLGPEAMDFAKWIAGHRAEMLKAEGRENLLNDTQIKGLKSLNEGQLSEPYTLANGKTTMSREAAYLDALKKYHALNENVMDLAVEGGLLTRKVADDLLKNPFYIPFYRVDPREGEQFVAPNSSSASVKQTAFKKLKGGTEQLNDLWENATSNWAHLIEAALKNKNTIPVLKTAVQQGAAVKLTTQEAMHLSDKEQKANTVWVMEDGEKQYYRIEDKGLFAAVSVLEPVVNIPVISPLARGAKNLLQTGVTMNPAFAVRNVIRDTQQVLATTPISWNVVNNLYTGFKENNAGRAIENLGRAIAGQELKAAGMSDVALSALAGGALMRFGDVADAGVRQTKVKNLIDTPEAFDSFWQGVKTAGGAYRKMMAQSEDVSRIALFKQLKDQGLPTDFAAFSAKDIADFSLTGAAQLVRTINSMSAFTNARMQGLYKVARSTAEADGNVPLAVGTRVGLGIAKRVATVVLAGALVDIALDALYANDEDWKKRDDFDKNSNYWFKIGSTEFRIPKGFEVGAVSRLGAIFVESFYDKEMTAGRALTNAYSILANNLNLNPTPTAIKPLLDIYGNSNAASGNPIVPRGLERLQADQRYTINNTLQARGISSAMNSAMRAAGFTVDGLSPIQIDYLARAYGGWLVTTTMQMGDTVARSFTSEPVKPGEDRLAYWTGGFVSSEPRASSRYVNMLYEQGDGIEKAYATYRDMLAQGRAADAQQFFAANKDEIQKHGIVSGVMRLEGDLNRQIRLVTNNPDPRVTAEQKKIQIMQIQAMKSRAAEQVFGAGR